MTEIFVRLLTGRLQMLRVCPPVDTVAEVKAASDSDSKSLRLTHRGRTLEEPCTLLHYGIESGDTLTVLPRLLGGAPVVPTYKSHVVGKDAEFQADRLLRWAPKPLQYLPPAGKHVIRRQVLQTPRLSEPKLLAAMGAQWSRLVLAHPELAVTKWSDDLVARHLLTIAYRDNPNEEGDVKWTLREPMEVLLLFVNLKNCKILRGKSLTYVTIEACCSSKISTLIKKTKEEIKKLQLCTKAGMLSLQFLKFENKKLNLERTISDYKIPNMSTLVLDSQKH